MNDEKTKDAELGKKFDKIAHDFYVACQATLPSASFVIVLRDEAGAIFMRKQGRLDANIVACDAAKFLLLKDLTSKGQDSEASSSQH